MSAFDVSRPRRWRSAVAALGWIAIAAGAGSAGAQTFTGSTVARRMVLPGPSTPLVPEPSTTGGLATPGLATPGLATPGLATAGPAIPAEADAPAVPIPAGRDRLVRLSAGRGGWRIDGESGTLDWLVYATPADASGPAQFRLVYRTDISVLPDASRVTVLINGVAIGTASGEAATRSRTVVFDVPPGSLKPGFNAVTMRADQRHRVDCSLPATYELWTEIDPARSGLILAGAAAAIGSLADLPALPVRADGALAIRIVVTGKLRPSDLARTLKAASAVAVASRTLHPVVDFGPLSAGAGINLVVGRDDEVDAVRGAIGAGDTLAAGLTLSPAVADRAATLVVSGASEPDLDAAITAVGRPSVPAGASMGLRLAAFPFGPMTEGGETLSLRRFGIGRIPFTGRRLTLELPLVLPTDFLPADYGRIVLNLVGENSAALGPTAAILVRVNDRDAASWPMAKAQRAGSFEQPLGLQLSLFRPGPNRIEIIALLPGSEPDGACPAGHDTAYGAQLTISDASSLVVPPLARIARTPELAAMAMVGDESRRLQVVAPQPDRDSLAAAATVAARLATAIGRAPEMTFSRKVNPDVGGDVLLVAPAQRLDVAAFAATRLDGEVMRQAWQARAEQVARTRSDPLTTGSSGDPNRGGPSACAATAMRPGASSPSGAGMPLPRPELAVLGVDPSSRRPGWFDDAVASSREIGRRTVEALYRPLDRVGGPLHLTMSSAFGPRSDEIALLAQGRAETGERLFVLTAPDPTDLKAAAECIVSPQRWSNLEGRAVAVSAADGALRPIAAGTITYSSPHNWGPGNVRLIAAGLLSLNPAVFVTLALTLAGVMTLSTTILVRNLGRRQP